jgi:hypothetical protein
MADDHEMPDRVWCDPTGLWLADDGIGGDQSSHRWTAYFSEHFREAEITALREQLARAREALTKIASGVFGTETHTALWVAEDVAIRALPHPTGENDDG